MTNNQNDLDALLASRPDLVQDRGGWGPSERADMLAYVARLEAALKEIA